MADFEYIKDIVKKNIFGIGLSVLGIILIISSIFIVLYAKENSCESTQENDIQEKTTIAIEEEIPKEETLKVDVKGAVKKPGVYELKVGTNVMDAITNAGGVTSKGVTTNINLSKKLTDEMVIYIFTAQEIKERNAKNEVVCEVPKCECETIEIQECPKVNESDKSDNSSTEKNDKVSINTATKEELMTLKGIGEAKAQDIIDYREKNGPFKTLEDLMKVSGIGEAAYEKLKEQIKL